MTFSTKQNNVKTNNPDDYQGKSTSVERDNSDNKLFKEIQVKDIREIITDYCIGVYDFDTPIYKACANMEVKSIVAKHITEGWEEEFTNITTFKGRGKNISKESWLGMKNLELEVEGKPLYKIEDFEISKKAKLKMDKEKAIEQVKIQIYKKIKDVKTQFRIPKVKVVIGGGKCFRHDLDLVRPYKGTRSSDDRPILLSEIREWVKKELDCEVARDGFEADDRVEHYGIQGYQHYRKTGKFNYLVIASDKDSKNLKKLLVDPDTYVGENNPLRGKYKFPQALLIEATDRDAGDIGIIQKQSSTDYKFYGFKGLLWQAFLSGDQADFYNCLSHLKQNLNFGDDSAYKLLKPCKTAKEALQKSIDKFAELLPYGVQYTSHKGEELDVDTMTYMNTYFRVAYMTQSYDDTMDFYKLCKGFKVDTSKIEGNNKLTPPVKTYVGNQDISESMQAILEELVNNTLKGYKSKKKDDLVKLLDETKEALSDTVKGFDSFYEMKQLKK